MKRIVVFLVIVCLSCKQSSKEQVNSNIAIRTTKPGSTGATATLSEAKETISLDAFNQLVPIDIVDTNSSDVYKKYGIDFSGYCYTCDLAKITITEKSMQLTNVCDEKQLEIYDVITMIKLVNGIELKTRQGDFIFTKIDNAPVYELKMTDNSGKNKQLRLSKYFTLEKLLNKFEQHNCGEFEG